MAKTTRLLTVIVTLALWGAPGAAQEPTYAEFRRTFEAAWDSGDGPAADAAVRAAPSRALMHFASLCKDQRLGTRKGLAATQEFLKASWARVWSDRALLDTYQTFYTNVSVEGIEQLETAEGAVRRAHLVLGAAERSRIRGDYERARDGFLAGIKIYARLGDQLHAAQAWQAIVYIYDRMPEATHGDEDSLVAALEEFVACRQAWSWTGDPIYEQNLLYLQEQKFLLGEGSTIRETLPFEPGTDEIIADLAFAALDELEPDMFAMGGPLPLLWPEFELVGDSHQRVPMFERTELFLRRERNRYSISSGEVGSDRSERVQANSNLKVTEFHLDAAGTPYAMWFYVGSRSERFMSADLDLSGSRDSVLVYYRSAASWTTEIDGHRVTFYDDNVDGKLFTPDPFLPGVSFRTLGEVTLEGTPVPAYDSMRIDRGRRVPYSEVVQVGDRWYALRGLDEGKKAGARPLDPRRLETGRVQLRWQHSKESVPEVLVIQGTGGSAGLAFEVSSGEPVEVPVGSYEIGFGRIVTGRGRQRQSALIFRGDAKPFAVEKGRTFELQMGAPFSLDYRREGTDTELVIDATSIRVLGRSGAIYANLNNAVPSPRVLYSRTSEGGGARRVGLFRVVRDAEATERFARHVPLLGFQAIAFPLPQDAMKSGNPVLRAPVPAGVFVGLHQDGHPLFDELMPVWKGFGGYEAPHPSTSREAR